MTDRQKLPPKRKDSVVEVELRHVVLAFAAIGAATFISGTLLVLVRDYTRYRRQKAILETIGRIIPTVSRRPSAGEKAVPAREAIPAGSK